MLSKKELSLIQTEKCIHKAIMISQDLIGVKYSKKAQNNYNIITDSLASCFFINEAVFEELSTKQTTISRNDFYTLTAEIANKIYADSITADLTVLFKKIEIGNQIEGVLYNQSTGIIKKIKLHNDTSYERIPVLIHEITHIFDFIFRNASHNSITQELFPRLTEKIASHELENHRNLEVQVPKIQKEVDMLDFYFTLLNYRNIIFASNTNLPIALQQKLSTILNSYGTIYSDLMATYLFYKYLEDKKTFIKKLNELFTQKISKDKFLKYYNSNMKNKEIVCQTNKRKEKFLNYKL